MENSLQKLEHKIKQIIHTTFENYIKRRQKFKKKN